MAFSDLPTVDDKSERSEESVLTVKGIFTRKNGFICRDESPDYGADQNVELVEAKGAPGSFQFRSRASAQ